jgi:micrococcal nuclease
VQPYLLPDVKIIHMIDPDSLIVRENGKLMLVQLIGADAPELTGRDKSPQCYDSEALKKAAAYFTVNRNISLSIDGKAGEKDQYGRDLRYVYLQDGSLYNENLLKEGLAKESNPQNTEYKFRDEFLRAQEAAKSGNSGIWNANGCQGQF